jgi:hypothetical protein
VEWLGQLCRECRGEHDRAAKKRYRERHPDKIAGRRKRYRERHPEQVKALHRRSYAAHAEEMRERNRVYREAHKEAISAKGKAYAARDPEGLRAYHRAWVAANHPPKPKVCPCGCEFLPLRGGARYCSEECRLAFCESRRTSRLVPPVESECCVCGAVTTSVRTRHYCSRKCQARAKDRKIVVFEGREVTYAVRAGILRKRRKGPYVWVPTGADACALCGEPIDPARKHGWGRADPLGATLGHEPPIAWLALHPEYDGPLVLRPEHWCCNMAKGTRPDWELTRRAS